MDVVTAMVRHVKSGDERVKTGTVALYTLNVLCRLLGETNPQLFIKVDICLGHIVDKYLIGVLMWLLCVNCNCLLVILH